MGNTRTEIQVGLALVAALVILISGLMWFQDHRIDRSYQTVSVLFPTVGGLGAGDPVDVRGIKMGQVDQINLVEGGVRVELRLLDVVEMRNDARVRIGSAGIMGERMVAVEPGRGEKAPASYVFHGEYEAAATDLVGQVEDFNTAVMLFLVRADSLLQDVRRDDRLALAVEHSGDAMKSLSETLSENRDDIREIVQNTSALTTRLDRFFTEHEADLAAGAEGMGRAAVAMDSISDQLGGVLADTRDILTALKDQKGAAGKLIFDEQAGENLVQTLEKMRFLVEDLQRNPERYLTVKIF